MEKVAGFRTRGGGGDRKLGGVKELLVQRGVEFEGSAKVDFHYPLV